MWANEELRQRLLYEDTFYKYYRPAANKNGDVKMFAEEIFQSLQKTNGMKLATRQIAHFGRFLIKTGMSLRKTSRRRLYLVVEK